MKLNPLKGNKGFFWTKNELITAKENPDNYFLYLINYLRMKEDIDYVPEIIANPYKNIYLSSQWHKDEKLWYIKPERI